MKKIKFPVGVEKFLFKAQKSSPEILIITAAVGAVAGLVTACVATTKVPEITEEHKEAVEKIHEAENSDEPISEDEAKKAITKVYARTILRFAKLYAVPAVIESVSIVCMLSSNHILRKRNIALGAAYTALDSAFKKYRNNAIARFGEEVDKELRFGLESKKEKETIIDENGKKQTVTNEIVTANTPPDLSGYARCFDELNPMWNDDAEINLTILKGVQRTYNDILKARGYVFLNEVYDALGFERTKAGQIVGWCIGNGDGYIDFGIFNPNNPAARRFVNGFEKAIFLDFNVDGPIIDIFQQHAKD